ncbi:MULTISPECIES: type II secretion system F family protein [Giesbergeria]|uniref:Type II secretion system F family protein n=1 Tax=Giesbergeria sinuosa TaxID=80883 RepID=A0ABV9QH07_9BURK
MATLNTYYYRVLLPHGALKSGLLRLAVERDLSARLRLEAETDGTVVHLWRLPAWLAGATDMVLRLFRHQVRTEDLAGFLRDLGLMMRAGVPALEGLKTLIDESDVGGNQAVATVARHMCDDLNAGVSMTEAFNRHPNIFPETVRNLVAIGDQSGTLDRMLGECADHVERMMNIKRDIKTALIYPAFVFATIFGVAGFWIYYVVPNMARLFKQLQAKLPPLTEWLVSFADALSNHLPWVVLVLVVLSIAVTILFKRSERFQVGTYSFLHRLPIARTLLVSSGMAHMTEHLSILVRAGVDLVSSLRILGRATKDRYYRVRLLQISESVSRGESVSSSMRRVGGFPAMAVRMIAVGEESGSLDDQLSHLAAEYRKRLEVLVKSLAEILKPVIILVAGGLFLFLIVALLLPIYDLVRQSVSQTMG